MPYDTLCNLFFDACIINITHCLYSVVRSVLDDVTSNEDARNVTYLPPRGDLTVDSHVRVDENDTKKSRLMETVRDRDSSNTYSAVDLERSPGKILAVLHQKVTHITPASCGVDSDVVSKPCSGSDKSNAAHVINSLKVMTPYDTFASEYAALNTRILAGGAAKALSLSSGLCTEEIINHTDISDTKSPSDSVVNRTCERNGIESTNTRADDRTPAKKLKETDIAVYSAVARQDIIPTGMLCTRCGQREQRVPDRAVKEASTECTTAEKATECFILALPTVDQFCETDKPSTIDMSVQTCEQTQVLETAKSTDQQPPVATVQSSVARLNVMSAPTREMVTQTFDDTHVKSKQNEDVDDCLTRVVKEVNDLKVAVGKTCIVQSAAICLPATEHSGTPCEIPCLHVDSSELVASDPKPLENDGFPGHKLYESRVLKEDDALVIAVHALQESHLLQEDDDVHVSPNHMLLESPCLHEENDAQEAIDKHTLCGGSPHLQEDDGKTFVGDHNLQEIPCPLGDDGKPLVIDRTFNEISCLHGQDGAQVIADGSPSLQEEDCKPLVDDQTVHESTKPLIGDQIVHESPNPHVGDQIVHESPKPLVGDEIVHESPKPLVGDEIVHESPKPPVGDQTVHECPKPLNGDQIVHESPKPLVGDEIVHESPKPLVGDEIVHESPKPLVGDQTVHECPKPLNGDQIVHESPKQLVDNQTVHESPITLVGDQTLHESPKPLVGDQIVCESPKPLVGDQIVHESPKPLVDDQILLESPLQGISGSQLVTDHTTQPPEETVISTPTTSPSSDDSTESLSFVSRLRNRLRGTIKSIQS